MAVTAPTAPTLILADGVSVVISWTAGSGTDEAVSYRIIRNGVVVGTSSITTYYDPAPGVGVTLVYSIQAVNATGQSATSATSAITVPTPAAPPLPDNAAAGSAPEVRILGNGSFAGASANIGSFNVEEDATPRSLVETGGGVGSISFKAVEDPGFDGSPALRGQPFELYDPDGGVQRGYVDTLSVREDELNVSGITLLQGLVGRRDARAYSGPLSGALVYYFSLGGVTSGITIAADAIDAASAQVNLPNWRGEVLWHQIRKLATIHGLEISAVASTFLVRLMGSRTVSPTNIVSERLTYGNDTAASVVALEYSTKEWKASGALYPDPEESIVKRDIISVDAGETVTTNIPVKAYLESVQQPIQVLSLSPDATNPSSAYAVLDKDGTPVNPEDWRNGGGSVIVAVGEDGRSVDVTVRGMITNSRAPYRIASGNADWAYGALYLLGSGVFFTEKEIWSATGASLDIAAADDVIRVEEELIDTDELAYNALSNIALDRAGFSAELEMELSAVNRRGETGIPVYPSFDEFDADYPTQTFDQFDALWGSNATFDDLDAQQADEVALDFRNQAYGGVGGSRLIKRDAWYRVVNATISDSGYSINAVADTEFDEFDEIWNSQNALFDDFDAKWGDATFEQFEISPLAR